FRNKAAFKVVVVAGGHETVMRARRLFDRLAAKLGPGLELKPTIWKFDLLASTLLLELASSEAVEADLVIVAPETATDLPPAIKVLFERWVREARKRVVILAGAADWEWDSDNGTSESAPVLNYFRQLSKAWDFEFFCDAEGLPADFTKQDT